MTTWWNCPGCNKVTDEFESDVSNKCPKCTIDGEKKMTKFFQTRFYKVENKNRHHNAMEWYFLSRTVNGQDYLFTKAQLDEAFNRAEKNPEDIPSDLISINPEEIYNEKEWLVRKNEELNYALDIEKRTARIWQYATLASMLLFYAIGYSVHLLLAG